MHPVSKEAEHTRRLRGIRTSPPPAINTNKLCMNNVHINRLIEISCFHYKDSTTEAEAAGLGFICSLSDHQHNK